MHIIDYLNVEQAKAGASTIGSLWATFEAKLLKPEITYPQRAAMKLAFYSGAGCLMKMLDKEIVKGEISEEEATKYIDNLQNEIKDFVKQTDRSKN